jgi:hypothetical protein
MKNWALGTNCALRRFEGLTLLNTINYQNCAQDWPEEERPEKNKPQFTIEKSKGKFLRSSAEKKLHPIGKRAEAALLQEKGKADGWRRYGNKIT